MKCASQRWTTCSVAARYELRTWDRTAAGIEDVGKIGLKGSPTVVSKVFAPQAKTRRAEIIEGETEEARDVTITLVGKLMTQHPELAASLVRRLA